MAEKDIVSKDILKRIAVDIARVLLHLPVEQAEILETEHQRVEDRHADLVALMHGEEKPFILHIEIQNDNQALMPFRMLRYRSDIGFAYSKYDVRQYVIYIGKSPLKMKDCIVQTGLDYRYQIIDMHQVDCSVLLAEDNPDALVLAILCDFKNKSAQDVIKYIVHRLKELTQDNESRFREYMRMLEILSTNRSLETLIQEEESMLSRVDQTKLPSYQIGMQQGIQQGMQQGMQQGELAVVVRLLTRRLGNIHDDLLDRVKSLTLEKLERLSEDLLEFKTVQDLEKWF